MDPNPPAPASPAASPADGPVRVEFADGVAWLTLDRPEARNALSRALVAAAAARLAELAARPDLRCLIVTGAGERAFCAGADLKERRGMDGAATLAFLHDLNALCDALAAFPRPVIAALGGAALGGGLELALACDLRIAAEGIELGLPEVGLGILPGAGGTQRLSRLCGPGVAKLLILTGRRVDAAEALRLGIVQKIVPAAALRAEVTAWARQIAAAGPLAVAQAKRAIDEGLGLPMAEALRVERAAYGVVLHSEDRDEGLRAFAEKRAPIYKGR